MRTREAGMVGGLVAALGVGGPADVDGLLRALFTALAEAASAPIVVRLETDRGEPAARRITTKVR